MAHTKVALVHYWLTGMRGGEKVLESLCREFPDADIFTNLYIPAAVSSLIRSHKVTTTFIQHLPFARRLYPYYLPLMPIALEQLDLRGYQLVISSESGPAKNVIVDPEALHVCYCHTPMRYLWDLSREYLSKRSRLFKAIAGGLFHYLRLVDVTSAARVDAFVANSRFTAQRVRKYWRRTSQVLHPPVDLDRFEVLDSHKEYYLWLGQLVPYKRPDLAVDAFNQNGRPLVVAGAGSELRKCRRRAAPNIKFLGNVGDDQAVRLLQECRALVFTGTEDFGIVPVEAMACGKPVVAFRHGGVLDTVRDGQSGVFFCQQTAEAVNGAIRRLDGIEKYLDPLKIRAWAERFGEPRFRKAVREIIDDCQRKGKHASKGPAEEPELDAIPAD